MAEHASLRVEIDLDDLPHADEKERLLDALGLGLEYELQLDAAEVPPGLAEALAVVTLTQTELYGALCDLKAPTGAKPESEVGSGESGGIGQAARHPRISLPVSQRNERAVHVQLHQRLPPAAKQMCATAAAARHAFMQPPTAPSVADAQSAELGAFMAKHLPAASRALELRDFDDTGRGLASTNPLREGDVALSVPASLLLTAGGLRARFASSAHAPALAALDDDTVLALALLLACADPSSCWFTYQAFLPSPDEDEPCLPRGTDPGPEPGADPMPHCSSWGETELAALQGTAVADEARAAVEALRAAYGAAVGSGLAGQLLRLQQAEGDGGRGDRGAGAQPAGVGGERPPAAASGGGAREEARQPAISFSRFRWAAAAVATRALLVDFHDGAGKVGTLVPVADMLNHHVRAQLASPSLSVEQGALVFTAVAPVPAGAQLRLFYGPLPAAELLLQYGFLDADALAAESVRFDLEPPDSDSEQDSLKKAVLLACGRYTDTHFVTAARPCPARLLGALRLCLLDAAGLEACLAAGTDLECAAAGAENEAMVWSTLHSLLEQMRSGLAGGTAADDDALLAASSAAGAESVAGAKRTAPPARLSYALETIVRWRLGQKRILDAALEAAVAGGGAAVGPNTV